MAKNYSKPGRPKKKGAVKPGQLQRGWARFTFITKKELITKVKKAAESQGISIKDYMTNLLEGPKEDKTVMLLKAYKVNGNKNEL